LGGAHPRCTRQHSHRPHLVWRPVGAPGAVAAGGLAARRRPAQARRPQAPGIDTGRPVAADGRSRLEQLPAT